MSATKTVRLGVKVSFLPYLCQRLGHFEKESLDVTLIGPNKVKAALAEGAVDGLVNWLHHAVFAAIGTNPLVGVMVFNDAPGITVMVADKVRDEIRTAADFAGRNVAQGGGYSAKSMLTNFLVVRAGLAADCYRPVFAGREGRREAILTGLNDGTVDVMTFNEPMATDLLNTKLVSPLYDFTTKATTVPVLGGGWPAESLMLTPAFMERDPGAAQSLVNTFVRTMRWVNAADPETTIAALPDEFFEGKNREAAGDKIRRTWGTLAKDDYAIGLDAAKIVLSAAQSALFDDSPSGRTRARCKNADIDPAQLHTNEFINRARSVISN
jgi:NitT/TauT family transport system substrate-binding protein